MSNKRQGTLIPDEKIREAIGAAGNKADVIIIAKPGGVVMDDSYELISDIQDLYAYCETAYRNHTKPNVLMIDEYTEYFDIDLTGRGPVVYEPVFFQRVLVPDDDGELTDHMYTLKSARFDDMDSEYYGIWRNMSVSVYSNGRVTVRVYAERTEAVE